MTYVATLKRVADGLVRKYEFDDDWDEVCEYMWSGGNYSCDCNRALFFARAANEPDPETTPCGDDKFVTEVMFRGVVVYSEEDGD